MGCTKKIIKKKNCWVHFKPKIINVSFSFFLVILNYYMNQHFHSQHAIFWFKIFFSRFYTQAASVEGEKCFLPKIADNIFYPKGPKLIVFYWPGYKFSVDQNFQSCRIVILKILNQNRLSHICSFGSFFVCVCSFSTVWFFHGRIFLFFIFILVIAYKIRELLLILLLKIIKNPTWKIKIKWGLE